MLKILIPLMLLINFAQAETMEDGQCRIHELDRYGNNVGYYTRGSCDDAVRLCNDKRDEESRCSRFPNGVGKFDPVGNKCRMWIVTKKYPNDLAQGRYATEKNCKRARYACRNYTTNYEKCVCRYFEIDSTGKWVSLYTRDTCTQALSACKKNKIPSHACSQDTYDPNKKVSFEKKGTKCNFLLVRNMDNMSVGTITAPTCTEAEKKCEAAKGPVHHCEKENIDGCRYAWVDKGNAAMGYFRRPSCKKARAACSSYINTAEGIRCIKY